MVAIDNSQRTEILRTQEQTFEKRLVETDSGFVEDRRDKNPVLDDDNFNDLLRETEAEFAKIDKTIPIEDQRAQFAKIVDSATKNISDNLDFTFPRSNRILSQEQLALLDTVRINAIPGREEEAERLRLAEQNKAFEKASRESQLAANVRLARERQEQINAIQNRGGTVSEATALVNNPQPEDQAVDMKARLRPFPAQAQRIYGTEAASELPTIMSILDGRQGGTNGVIFPYTPIIQYMPTTEYAKYDPTHSNTDYHTYHRTQAVQLQLSGKFTAQSPKEAVYCLAVIHFLRTITKMRFGRADDRRGEPPPLLLFDCYGWYMFNRLPVIITGFSLPYEKDVDYVPVDTRPFFDNKNVGSSVNSQIRQSFGAHVPRQFDNPNITWIPANFTISISMYVQVQPKVMRKEFDLNKFRTGELFSERNSIFNTKSSNSFGGGWL